MGVCLSALNHVHDELNEFRVGIWFLIRARSDWVLFAPGSDKDIIPGETLQTKARSV